MASSSRLLRAVSASVVAAAFASVVVVRDAHSFRFQTSTAFAPTSSSSARRVSPIVVDPSFRLGRRRPPSSPPEAPSSRVPSVRRASSESEPSPSASSETSEAKDSADEGGGGGKEEEEEERPWWKRYEMSDPELPELVRDHFPILSVDASFSDETTNGEEEEDETKKKRRPLIYLDSAATSQKPTAVVQAISSYYERINSNVHRGAHSLSRRATESYENARDTIAHFVNARSRNEIVYTSGATEAINLVANSFAMERLSAQDEIVLSVMEHHSNLVPWQTVSRRTGCKLRFVPVDDDTGGLDMDALEGMLNANTKLVALQHVSNVMGCVNPVRRIVELTRSRSPDAKILLDACQSVPHMKVDVRGLGIDFLAASGHKMCGPTGIGFLWGREDLLDSMPPYMGGGEMIDEVRLDSSTYAASPARFEAGTPPIAQAIGLGRAIEYLSSIGMDRIEKYEHDLAEYLHRRLDDIDGVTVLGPPAGVDRAALCSFVCDDVHPSDLSSFLDMEGVAIRAGHHCCQPLHTELGYSHSARASLYFYNTKEEVDAFVEHLEETIRYFKDLQNASGDDDDDFVPFV